MTYRAEGALWQRCLCTLVQVARGVSRSASRSVSVRHPMVLGVALCRLVHPEDFERVGQLVLCSVAAEIVEVIKF